MIIYYILLVFLLILWFLFVYYFKVKIEITERSIKIKFFFITLINIKDDKFYDLIASLIPKDKISLEKDIDYTRLISFVHIDYLENNINIENYNLYIIISTILDANRELLIYYLDEYIKEYSLKINANNSNGLYLKMKMRFNIGIILLNVILIKMRYRNEKINQ